MRNLIGRGGICPPWLQPEYIPGSLSHETFLANGLPFSSDLVDLVIKNTLNFARGNMFSEHDLEIPKLKQPVPYGVDLLGYYRQHILQFIKDRTIEDLFFLTAGGEKTVRLTARKYEKANYCGVCVIGSHCTEIFTAKADRNYPLESGSVIDSINYPESGYLESFVKSYQNILEDGNQEGALKIEEEVLIINDSAVKVIAAVELPMSMYRIVVYI